MTTVVKEDGTTISGANSLISLSEFKTLAANFKDSGELLAAGDDVISQRIVDGWRTIENNMMWFGRVVSSDATRLISFPRTGLRGRTGLLYLATQIPDDLKYAQARMSVAIHNYALLEQAPSDITSYTTTGVTVGLKTRDNVGSRKDTIPSEVYDILTLYGKTRTEMPVGNLNRKQWA
jgi:hypothetical protein